MVNDWPMYCDVDELPYNEYSDFDRFVSIYGGGKADIRLCTSPKLIS